MKNTSTLIFASKLASNKGVGLNTYLVHCSPKLKGSKRQNLKNEFIISN